MDIQRYRILEWTSVFRSGATHVGYELQVKWDGVEGNWVSLGTAPTHEAARRALLSQVPTHLCARA